MQAPGQIQVQHLVIAARRGDQRAHGQPLVGGGAGLLPQFPPGGGQRLLALFPLAGGDLQQRAAEGVAVLPHQQHAAVILQRQNAHAAGMLHHLPHGGIAVGQQHLVPPHADDAAVIDLLGSQRLFRHIHKRVPPVI